MATEVENRVVAMEFDNKNFEKNMAHTMKTLQEFDDQLNFKGAEKGFKTLEDASKKCDLSPLSNAVAALEMKFSTLQIVAVSAINRIVNSAMDAGTRIVKSLTFEPVATGFAQYETKIQSVQTIINATGKSLEEVETTLDRLAVYTDETSYNFSDMVDNIGKFTANNIELDRAANAMQGIANWAAASGQTAAEAGRAMYNLSQALSVGAVTAIDWKSIEMANMATKEFKEMVIQTAKEMGKLNSEGKNLKGNIVTIESFRDTLSDKWFDSDVLINTLEKYNAYSDLVLKGMEKSGMSARDVMEELDKYIEESGDETLKFAAKVFKAAQEARTFNDVINATKDAVKTGWQRSFDIIIGDLDEAKELYGNLVDVFYDIFAASAESRNEVLQDWKELGGRSDLLKAFSDAFENITRIINAFKVAYRDVFPKKTGANLAVITKGLSAFVSQLRFSDEALKTVTNAVRTFLIPFKVVSNLFAAATYGAMGLTIQLFRLVDGFLAANSESGIFAGLIMKIFGEERYSRLATAMGTIINNLGTAFSNLLTWVKGLFGQTPQAEAMHKIWESISTILGPIAGWILDRIVDGFETLAKLDFSNLTNLGTDILNGIVSAFQSIITYLPPATGNIGEFLNKFSTATPGEFFTMISDGFAQLSLSWTKFKDTFTISGFVKAINTQINNLMGIVNGLGDAFVRLVERLDPAKILVSAFGVTLVGTIWSIKRAIEAGTSVLTNFSGVLGALKKRIDPQKINPTVKALILLAGAMAIMALVPAEQLRQATISMMALVAAVGVLSAVSVALDKFNVKTGAVKQLGITMTYISGAVATLAVAMAILNTVETEGLLPRLIILGSIMAALAAVCIIMSKNSKEFTKGSAFMIAYAISINLMITALNRLAEVDLTGIQKNLGALIVVVGLMGVIGVAASKVKFSSAVGMTGMIANILLLCGVLKILSNVDMNNILKGLIAFIPIIGAVGAISLALRVAGQNGAKMGATFLALSASIIVLAQGVKMLSSLDPKQIATGAIVMGGMIVIFGLFAKMSKLDKDQKSAKMGATFIAMSVALLALSGAINILGKMDESVVRQGTVIVGTLMLMFGGILSIGKQSKGAMGAILAITAAIGTLIGGLALLTLLDEKELLTSAAAMSAIFLAFGVAMKNIKTMGVKEALGTIPAMVLFIGGVASAIYALSKINYQSSISSAAALSILLLSIATMTRIIGTIDGRKYNSYIKTIKLVGLFLAEAVAALAVLSLVNGEGMMEKAAALSLLIVAMTSVAAAISLANIDAKKVAKGAGGIDAVILIIGGLVAGLGALDSLLGGEIGNAIEAGGGVLTKLSGVVPVIALFGLIAAALSKFPIDPATASMGAASIDAVIGIIGGLVAAVGALNELFDGGVERLVESGGEILLKLGSIIGGFIGNLIGGLVGGLASGALPVVAENLALFATNITPFLALGTAYNSKISDNISSLVSTVTDLTTAGQIWQSSGVDFNTFGSDLELLSPHLASFAKGLSDAEFDATKVDSASNMANAIANILSIIPKEGGVKAAIFGETDFGSFVEALGKLGPAIAQLARDVEGISPGAFDNAITALKVVAEFAKNDIPASGGLLQDLIGEQNLGTFGEQLDKFADPFVSFTEKIANLDDSVVTQSEIVAKSIGAMAKVKIPTTGGFIDSFLGSDDIDLYGKRLADFATQFGIFKARIYGVDENTVSQSAMVAESVKAMASVDIPSTGGFLDWLTGKSDLATFGTQLQTLGAGLSSYNESIKPIILNRLNGSIDAVVRLASLSSAMEDFNQYSVINFTNGIQSLADVSIEAFTTTWEGSDEKIASAINTSITNAVSYFGDSTEMTNAAEAMVAGFIDGIDQNESKISESGKNLAHTFETSIRDTRPNQVRVGSYIIAGLNEGIKNGIPDAKKTITELTNAIVETAETNLQIASPSKKFIQIGEYIVAGLKEGISQNEKNADNSALDMAMGVYNTVIDYFEIHSPSVRMEEVGKYIVQGVGEGMKKDMTAEEIAAKKAENIVKAFSDAAAAQTAKFKQNDILYEIWQLENQMATDEEKIAKEREFREKELTEAIKEHQDALAQLQALERDPKIDKESKTYLEAQQKVLDAKKEVVSQANELTAYDYSSAQSLRDQAKAMDDLKAESRDLEYTRWELTHKTASVKETYDRKELIQKQKLTDQEREYNRLVAYANDLIRMGYTETDQEYVSAVNAVNEQYNKMLETGRAINDLQIERKNAAREEADAVKDAYMAYVGELQELIKLRDEGAAGFAGKTNEELEAYARRHNKLDENFKLTPEEKSPEEYINESGLDKLVAEGVEVTLNLDEQTKQLLEKYGFSDDFTAEFPIFDGKLIYEKSTSAGKSASSGFSNGLNSNGSPSTLGENYGNDFLSGLGTTVEGAVQVGKDMIAGVGSGAIEETDKFRNKMRGWFYDNVEDPIRTESDTHSPSRKMAEIGSDFIQGLIVGMDDKESALYQKARAICAAMIRTFYSTVDNYKPSNEVVIGGSLGIGASYQPVIRPVVDMDDLSKGLNTAKKLLDTTLDFTPFGNTFKAASKAASEISKSKSQNGAVSSSKSTEEESTPVVFNQYNNAPKLPSRLDLYRDTTALLSQAKTVLKKGR